MSSRIDWVAFANSCAESLYLVLGRVCLIAGLSVLAVYVFCRACPRLPAVMRCWLWWLVCLSFVVGFLWGAPFVLPLLSPLPPPRMPPTLNVGGQRIPATVNWMPASATETPEPPPMPPELRKALAPGATWEDWEVWHKIAFPPRPQMANPFWTWPALLSLYWLLGVLIRVLVEERKVVAQRRHLRSLPAIAPEMQSHLIRELKDRLGLRRTPRVVCSPAARAPYISGLLRPVVVLPVDFFDFCTEEEQRMALAHELAHLRRGDLWLSLVPLLAHSLFFFFPFAWLARREWLVACEAACDEQAIGATSESPQRYAQMLLKISTRGRRDVTAVMLGVTAGYPTLKRRLSDMVNCALRPMWRISRPVLAATIGVGVIAMFPWRFDHRDACALSTHYMLEDLQINPPLPSPAINVIHPFSDSGATAINDRGQIVGTFYQSLEKHRAFLWDNAHGKQEIGALDPEGDSEAAAINSSGQIVGRATIKRQNRAFFWDAAHGMRSIDPSDSLESAATGINARGQVVGYVVTRQRSNDGLQSMRAFLWDAEHGMRFLPARPQVSTRANAINNRGQIAGCLYAPHGPRACLWETADSNPQLLDLVPGVRASEASAIDETGRIVGGSVNNGRAFLWTASNGIENLGTLPDTLESTATDINAVGQVIGSAATSHGFIWDRNFGMRDIAYLVDGISPDRYYRTSGQPGEWYDLRLMRQNAHGWIAGSMQLNGQRRAVLLRPQR